MNLLEPLPTGLDCEDGFCRPSLPVLLIVDDEEGPRESLKIILQDDYEVLLAESGYQALELLKEHSVAAAVLDIRMGGMTGIELLKQIKQQAPDVGVIMLTAYETVETARQALRLGACDYLAKPFDLFTMRSAVAKAVEQHRCAQQMRANQEQLGEIQSQLRDYQIKEELARKQGEIYGMVLHDINNPLTVISGLAMLASERLQKLSLPGSHDLVSVKSELTQIDQQVRKCLEISKRYLGFVRRRPTERPVVGVNRLLADLRMLLRPNPSLAGKELQIEPLPEEAGARINGTDLVQILLNLTINALQCGAQPLRVKLTAQRLQGALNMDQHLDGPRAHFLNRAGFDNHAPLVRISIQDNGPGIAVTPVAKVFEAFFTTKKVGQGTGLGLTIVLHLVEQAGAGLYLESRPGEGTIFTLFLNAE
jgi:two-component system sensor histidine kinase/response regulator